MKKALLLLSISIILLGCPKDPCDNAPCQNGGYCNNGSCVCPCGYTGTKCDIKVPPCGSIPSNGTIITPIIQQEQAWCWLTCGEMIFRYYSIPQVNLNSYQCGIIGTLNPQCNSNCTVCAYMSGTMSDVQLMLNSYPKVACQANSCPNLSSTIEYSPLTIQQLSNEMDNRRPVLAGISPNGIVSYSPQHAVLIVGSFWYNNVLWLSVNDPWPYNSFPVTNPYLLNGGNTSVYGNYNIPYFNFIQGLAWTQSLYGITL